MELVAFLRHGYGRFDGRQRIGPACWPHADLLWVHSGRIELFVGDGPGQALARGQGVLILPHTPFRGHALSRSARASIQHFLVHPRARSDRLPQPLKALHHARPGFTRYEAEDAEAMDEMINGAMRLASMPGSPMVASMRLAQLTLILGHLALSRAAQPPRGPHRDRLGALLERLRRRPEERWTLERMAEQVGMSASHFRAVFREQVGVSPGQFQQQTRMAEAARLLRDTADPIKQIARRMGYRDLSHFYRQFHAAHAQTPHAYRRTHRPTA